MNNTINGKPRDTEAGAASEMPLLAFLAAHDVNPKLVAVAINGDVIPKSTFDTAIVREGDAIEIVRMVGGGSDLPSPVPGEGPGVRAELPSPVPGEGSGVRAT